MTQPNEPDSRTAHERTTGRRGFVKGLGGAAATVATLTYADGPVDSAAAEGPATAMPFIPLGPSIGVGAGVYKTARDLFPSFSDDWEGVADEIKEQNSYSTAISLEAAFERQREEFELIAERGQFEDALWAEIRAAGYRAFEDEGSVADALNEAEDRMDEVFADALRSMVAAHNAEVESNIPIWEVWWDIDNRNVEGVIDADFDGSYDPDDFWSAGNDPHDHIADCPETTLIDGWRGYCAIEADASTMPDDEPVELLCMVQEPGNTGGDRNVVHPWFHYAEEQEVIDDEWFGMSGGIGA